MFGGGGIIPGLIIIGIGCLGGIGSEVEASISCKKQNTVRQRELCKQNHAIINNTQKIMLLAEQSNVLSQINSSAVKWFARKQAWKYDDKQKHLLHS